MEDQDKERELIPEGSYRARGVKAELSEKANGDVQVVGRFVITQEGEFKGRLLTWYGHMSEKTQARTCESLIHCGMDLADLETMTGFDRNEVELQVEHVEYQGKWGAKIKWVNALMKITPPNEAKRAQAVRSLRGGFVAAKAKLGSRVGGHSAMPEGMRGDDTKSQDDIPF